MKKAIHRLCLYVTIWAVLCWSTPIAPDTRRSLPGRDDGDNNPTENDQEVSVSQVTSAGYDGNLCY